MKGSFVPKLIFLLVLAALVVGNVVLSHNLLTQPYPGLNDFMSRWEGARSYWQDGLNPYSDEASLNIQFQIYGRPIVPGEDPGYFVYPFYTVFALLPLVSMSYAWASAIWLVILEVCLIGALLLSLNLFQWRPRPLLMTLLILWTILHYYGARGLLLGQVGIVVYLFEVLALWALAKDYDRLAGIALALSTLKPQMGFLLIPFLLLWGLRAHRWQFVATFALVLTILGGVSFLLQPSWLGDWIAQMRLYPVYTAAAYPDTGSPVWIIMQHYLGLGEAGEWFINLLFFVFLGWVWWGVLVKQRDERLMWALMVTLTVTHLVAVRTATTHFVVFTLPLVFYLKMLTRRHAAWTALLLIALILLPWAHFLITVQGRDTLEHPALFLPPTLGMFLLLWITRQQWWNSQPLIATRKSALNLIESRA